jgi:hypothetical protein
MHGVVKAPHHGGRVEMKRYRSVAVCYDKRARWGSVDHQIASLDGYRSTGSLTSIMKSVGGTTTIIPHVGLFTVQAVAVIGGNTSRNATTVMINVVARI